MNLEESADSIRQLWSDRRKIVKPIDINNLKQGLIEVSQLPGQTLPLVIKANVNKINLDAWAKNNQQWLETQLFKHGAILFRNFDIDTVIKFEQFTKIISGELLEYSERSSPRSQISGHVYTSTDYPANQSIFPHNEHSYCQTWPMKLFFCCITPAQQGGETPIADCRKVLQRIDPKIVERFISKNWMYVRNYNDGFGLAWQTVFQTTDKSKVEEYCRSNDIEFEWKDGKRLRTRQVRPVITRHPQTGEMVWFNHATFFHVSTLEPTMRDALLAEFKEEDLPNNTYYGDGSVIEPSVLDELRQTYLQETVALPWQQGDILMLDNMLTAHSRKPFSGARKILFAMTEPCSRQNI
ncbi:MAG: TauD/TfdA family dioxygenase [Nostoc sp.]